MEGKSKLIGRGKEQEILQACVKSDSAELIAVYGRRRIGKTFLIKQFFKNTFDFYTSGIFEASKQDEIAQFCRNLSEYSHTNVPTVKNWFEAFDELKLYLSSVRKKKIIVFIDELPWFDTPKSNFIKAFEIFWNTWAADNPKLKLIVCGSATTWMTNKLLGNKGGLHNRVTRRIRLNPFSLNETGKFLRQNSFNWSKETILNCYMTFGGTPFYLKLLRNDLSLDQNIDALFFSQSAELKDEYDFLFRSLFKESQSYKRVIELLAQKGLGMTRQEIVSSLHITDNGALTEILDNLERCDFIRAYAPYGKKIRGVLYQLIDLYSLFYLRFVKDYRGRNEAAWSNLSDTKKNNWRGYAFEQVCLHHLDQIKKALGISGIECNAYSWYYNENGEKAQIDLLIDRADNVINVCEIKYSTTPYVLKKQYAEYVQERMNLFREHIATTKTLHLTFISSSHIKKNKLSDIFRKEITINDLYL